jgi:hypothetical protein
MDQFFSPPHSPWQASVHGAESSVSAMRAFRAVSEDWSGCEESSRQWAVHREQEYNLIVHWAFVIS